MQTRNHADEGKTRTTSRHQSRASDSSLSLNPANKIQTKAQQKQPLPNEPNLKKNLELSVPLPFVVRLPIPSHTGVKTGELYPSRSVPNPQPDLLSKPSAQLSYSANAPRHRRPYPRHGVDCSAGFAPPKPFSTGDPQTVTFFKPPTNQLSIVHDLRLLGFQNAPPYPTSPPPSYSPHAHQQYYTPQKHMGDAFPHTSSTCYLMNGIRKVQERQVQTSVNGQDNFCQASANLDISVSGFSSSSGFRSDGGPALETGVNPAYEARFSEGPCFRVAPKVCFDWLVGRCNRQRCRYLHMRVPEKPNNEVQDISKSQPPPPGEQVCWDWLADRCNKDEGSCPHAHNFKVFRSDEAGPTSAPNCTGSSLNLLSQAESDDDSGNSSFLTHTDQELESTLPSSSESELQDDENTSSKSTSYLLSSHVTEIVFNTEKEQDTQSFRRSNVRYRKSFEVCRRWKQGCCPNTALFCLHWHLNHVPEEVLMQSAKNTNPADGSVKAGLQPKFAMEEKATSPIFVANNQVNLLVPEPIPPKQSLKNETQAKEQATPESRHTQPSILQGSAPMSMRNDDKAKSSIVKALASSNSEPAKKRQVCRKWLKQCCPVDEKKCYYYHTRDLPPEEPMSYVLNDHNRVVVSAGFTVEDVSTAFDTSCVYVSGLPSKFGGLEEVKKMLDVFGPTSEVKLWDSTSSRPTLTQEGRKNETSQTRVATKNVKAYFAEPRDALQAVAALNGTQVLGSSISATVPLTSAVGTARARNTDVRVSWDAPKKIGYGGYSTLARAEEAISLAKKLLIHDSYISAKMHHELPAVHAFTVKFSFVPNDVTSADMKQFANPEEIVWEPPNYSANRLDEGIEHVKTMLMAYGDLKYFEVVPPPWRHGKIKAWASFSDVAESKRAAQGVSGRKLFNGKAWIEARNVKIMKIHVSESEHARIADELQEMRKNAWLRGDKVVISELPGRLGGKVIKLTADDLKQLAIIKEKLEVALRGEVLLEDSESGTGKRAAWDTYFNHPAGSEYMTGLRTTHPAVRVEKDDARRKIRLFGKAEQRAIVREALLQKLAMLRRTKRFFIPISGRLLGSFYHSQLPILKKALGPENVDLRLWESVVVVRGDTDAHEKALDAIHRCQEQHPASAGSSSLARCPVCFGEITSAVYLPCGHIYCKACFAGYLESATDTKIFPVRCIGDEAKCSAPISLYIARRMLSAAQFETLVEVSFQTYIHSRSKDFHYCPTPDCHQIYRHPAPEGAILQCPECLVRICPRCDTEYHDGFDCPESKESQDERKFREWKVGKDVKSCPGCQVVIERTEGCNHVRCSKCGVHICWVCLERFGDGNVVYEHLQAVHGGVGIAFAV